MERSEGRDEARHALHGEPVGLAARRLPLREVVRLMDAGLTVQQTERLDFCRWCMQTGRECAPEWTYIQDRQRAARR